MVSFSAKVMRTRRLNGSVHPRRTYKDRLMSSSVFANSEGRRAGNPKHSFPSSMAGSQKQPFSTGKQRNAVTGRPAKATSRPKTDPSGRVELLSTRLTGCELSRSEAARILLAKWNRSPHWCSRSVKDCAQCKYGPIKRTSLPDIVIYRLPHTDDSFVAAWCSMQFSRCRT
jgi:hypothetical protein